jgi:transposase-like protein
MTATLTIDKLTIKFLGKKETVYRLLDQAGEVVAVYATKAEAEAAVAAA